MAEICRDLLLRHDPFENGRGGARAQALPAERIMGVETGGCLHTAIREDASMNLAAIETMNENRRRSGIPVG